MRGGSIQKFLDDYGSHSNFQWSLETFQDTSATALVMNSSSQPIFSSATAMQSAITTFLGMLDNLNTPYMAALTMATSTIAADPDLNGPSNPQYLVVFMSDGQPTGTNDQTLNILSQIQAMVNLSPGKITFNTVYYGTNDVTAAGLLSSMASIGNGNFLNTNANPSGLDFKISDLINIPCP